MPITIDTWPGPTKPSKIICGSSNNALIGGGTVMWLQKMVKFVSPSASACRIDNAVEGVVVSNPRPKNTTSRSGLRRASSSASSGE